jgi:hypothetical protein
MRTLKKPFWIILVFLIGLSISIGCGKKRIIDDTPGKVEGHVYIKNTSPPIPIDNAEILLSDQVLDTTDSTGYYYIVTLPGKKVIKAQAKGYESQTKEVIIEKNKTLTLDFYLNREE